MRSQPMVALTPNALLNKCKRKLGIKTFFLPMKDEELMDVLFEDTLPTFSRFYPRYATLKLNLDDCPTAEYAVDKLPKVSYGRRAYHFDITRYGQDLVVVDIEDVKAISSDFSEYRDYGNMGMTSGYDLFTRSFAQANMEAMLRAPIVFYYEAPDILILDEPGLIDRNILSVTFLLVHAYDLSTVKITYIDKITDLFMLDLQLTLHPLMKHMDKIDTTFGQIDLKIDNWESAEDKHKDLIADWESNFLAHRRTKLFRK